MRKALLDSAEAAVAGVLAQARKHSATTARSRRDAGVRPRAFRLRPIVPAGRLAVLRRAMVLNAVTPLVQAFKGARNR